MNRAASLLTCLVLLSGCGALPGGGSFSGESAADVRDVEFGAVQHFGEVARVCDAKGRDLGQQVNESAASGYRLYDSKPGTSGARSYYITGFSDGCPRQLTAANVLLAGASDYEQIRFGPAGENLPYGETDATYEQIKGQVCGTRRGQPCGKRIASLDKNTFFVSAYERFGETSRWSEILVHDGDVMAVAMKSAN